MRNAVSRIRVTSVWIEKSISSKISLSGRKWIFVPESPLSALPTTSMSASGAPRSNSWR